MKSLLDFIPLIIFFALYKIFDIYIATGGLIVATTLQLTLTYWLYKKVEKMQLITFVTVAIFGSMTIFLHDDNFIKWKVTIIYALFAIGLTTSQLLGKSAIKSMLAKELTLPEFVWTRLTWAWVIFFAACALTNIYVAFTLPLDTWVNFKVFGLLAATFAFVILSGIYIYKHAAKSDIEE